MSFIGDDINLLSRKAKRNILEDDSENENEDLFDSYKLNENEYHNTMKFNSNKLNKEFKNENKIKIIKKNIPDDEIYNEGNFIKNEE